MSPRDTAQNLEQRIRDAVHQAVEDHVIPVLHELLPDDPALDPTGDPNVEDFRAVNRDLRATLNEVVRERKKLEEVVKSYHNSITALSNQRDKLASDNHHVRKERDVAREQLKDAMNVRDRLRDERDEARQHVGELERSIRELARQGTAPVPSPSPPVYVGPVASPHFVREDRVPSTLDGAYAIRTNDNHDVLAGHPGDTCWCGATLPVRAEGGTVEVPGHGPVFLGPETETPAKPKPKRRFICTCDEDAEDHDEACFYFEQWQRDKQLADDPGRSE